MPYKISDIREKLHQAVPPAHLKERTGPSNQKVHYVDGDYVIHQLNENFGVENVDILTSEMVCEAERTMVKVIEVRGPYIKEQRTYGPNTQTNVPYVEFTYRAKVTLKVTIFTETGEEKVITKEGTGVGYGTGPAQEFNSLHQYRQMAIKAAETDAIKRAAKKLGARFGLSIGKDGKQAYATYSEDEVMEVGTEVVAINHTTAVEPEPAAAAATTQAPVQAADATQTAAPAAVQPAKAPEKPVQATQQASQPAQQVAQTARQPQTEIAKPATVTTTQAAPVTEAVKPIIVDEAALKVLDITGWTAEFRQLSEKLTQTKNYDEIMQISKVASSYLRLLKDSEQINAAFKKQAPEVMTRYLNARAVKLELHNIDFKDEIENEIARQTAEAAQAAGATAGATQDEDPFVAPF